jgi:hypothetical protein
MVFLKKGIDSTGAKHLLFFSFLSV